VSVAPIAEAKAECHADHEPEHSESDLARLSEAIQTLPKETRRVIELRKVHGWNQRRIAMHLNLPDIEVERHLRAAVLLLHRALFDPNEDT
jgi:DNA-directed RNA polymerase specialized sigma24 family protein